MRLIDADALYERIAGKEELARRRVVDTPSRLPNGDFNPYATRYATQLDERTTFKFMIADAPTIEVAPVKHGRWIKIFEDEDSIQARCSACGMVYYLGKGRDPNYCGNCGAKMDEVEE